MIDRIQTTLDGLMAGASYALLAIGFTLIFGVMRRLNLAYGPTVLAGTYLGSWAFTGLGVPLLLVAPLVVGGAVIAGLYVERLCFRPFAPDAAMASMVSSFAIWMQIEELATLVMPRHTNPFPALVTGPPLGIGPFAIRLDQAALFAVALAGAATLYVTLTRTRFGLGIRSVIDNPRAAEIVGIPVRRVMLGAFALASGLGGLAGLLIAAGDQQVTPMLGMWATNKGLIAMMLGGLGSIPGAIAGGLLLGVIEQHAQSAFGPQVRDLVAWGLLFAILVLRPGGLLGSGAAGATTAASGRV